VAVDFVPVRITDSGGSAVAAWAEGMRFTLPRAMLERTRWAEQLTSAGDLALSSGRSTVFTSDVDEVREHAAFTENPPMTARLPVSYQRVPAFARAFAASVIGWRQRRRTHAWATFPGWPLDLTADLLADLASVKRVELGSRTPVLLTHDIDSAEGLTNLVAAFLQTEEAVGAKSTSYVVPCKWPLDQGLLAEIARRGHQLGVHGYDHSNRTPFVIDEERRRRLDGARAFIDRYDASGYRAPSLLRTRVLLRALASRYRYDSSIPTSGGLFPVPNNGCASARPFVAEGIIEIPLSLPRDGSLRFLGYRAPEILRMWIDCADAIARSMGIVVLLTHCEARFSGNRTMLDAYQRFIEYVADHAERFTFSTPDQLLPMIQKSLKVSSAIH
jgi:peptidoglycan/xylan/chitin deacetylase (PgdA/CDA1 family)